MLPGPPTTTAPAESAALEERRKKLQAIAVASHALPLLPPPPLPAPSATAPLHLVAPSVPSAVVAPATTSSDPAPTPAPHPCLDPAEEGTGETLGGGEPQLAAPPGPPRRWLAAGSPFPAASLLRLTAALKPGTGPGTAWETLLTFAVISIGAYLGSFIRVGFQYYRGTASQVVFTVMYAQILGCFIMGCMSEFQQPLMAGARLHRLLYVFVATGLCGSITTFSTWQFEANKLFVLQADTTWGNVGLSYNGGRLLDYLVQLWVGVVLPLAALNAGQHLVQAVGACRVERRERKAAAAITAAAATTTGGGVPSPTIVGNPLAKFASLGGGGGAHRSSSASLPLLQQLGSALGVGGRSTPLAGSTSGGSSGDGGDLELKEELEMATRMAGGPPSSSLSSPGGGSTVPGGEGGGAPPPPRVAARCGVVDVADPATATLIELGVLAFWAVSTILVVALPVVTGWVFLAFTAGLGCVGAYARFRLAPLNKALPSWWWGRGVWAKLGLADGAFPWGTFIANMVGTWVLALVMALAKFSVSYHDHLSLAVLYGMATGFCGCLTTMSTFVLELHRLPRRAGYIYGITSFFVAQVGWGIIFDAYAVQAGLAASNTPRDAPRMAFCPNFVDLCDRLLTHVNCTTRDPALRQSIGCSGPTMATFVGSCTCGGFDASVRVQELLIDSQAKANVSGSLVAVWPTAGDGGGGGDPAEAIDACISFQNLCDHTLQR